MSRKEYYLKNKEKLLSIARLYKLKNKELLKEKAKEYYKKNKIVILAKQKIYLAGRIEKTKEYFRKYRILHKEELRRKKKIWSKEYYLKNKDLLLKKSKEYCIKYPEKRKITVKMSRAKCTNKYIEYMRAYLRKARRTLRGKTDHDFCERMRESLKCGKGGKNWNKLCGYSTQELMDKLFGEQINSEKRDKFMIGILSIDHKTPLSWFNYNSFHDKNFKLAWSLDNLHLLEKTENIEKSNKYVSDVLLTLQQFGRG